MQMRRSSAQVDWKIGDSPCSSSINPTLNSKQEGGIQPLRLAGRLLPLVINDRVGRRRKAISWTCLRRTEASFEGQPVSQPAQLATTLFNHFMHVSAVRCAVQQELEVWCAAHLVHGLSRYTWMQSMLDLCMAEFRCSAENGSCECVAFGRRLTEHAKRPAVHIDPWKMSLRGV